MTDKDTNPRGFKRPHSGIGRGVGVPGGRRGGMNPEPCPTGEGEGRATGSGIGKGKNRK